MGQYGAIIGGVVGAVVGSVVPGLGTSLGWAIGSALGGAYSQSQQVLPGPKIGDVAQQTAQEGGFRPIVYGRSHPIAGNIIADGGPVIVTRRERQGKGGPKVESESAYRTYAVGVCEGEAQLLQAWRNGILVYDAEDGSMAAENAKFLEYATWYTGSFDQPESPDLEEIYGAGQAPFFRGTAYLSIHNEDVTDQRGAWSQWQFRVFRGAAKSYTTPPYPAYSVDSLGARSTPHGGGLQTWPMDEMSSGVLVLGGEIRSVQQDYEWSPESMDSSATPLGGQIRELVLVYDLWPPEEMEASAQPLGGLIKTVVIPYENWPPEEMSAAAIPLGGEIT